MIRLPLDTLVKGEEGVWVPITEGHEHGDLQIECDHAVLEGQLLVLAVGNGRQVILLCGKFHF